MAQAARGKKDGGNRRAKAKRAPRQPEAVPGPWQSMVLAVILGVLALRAGILMLGLLPVHQVEAQNWAYAQELDWGYFAAEPMAAWVVRAMTDLGGDTLFWLRLTGPLAHGLIAWLIFLTGRRLWDGETGFWAAAGYTAAPGAALSSMILSAEPVMMVFWAAALYAMVRADAAGRPLEQRIWWGVTGAAAGTGMLAQYSMIGFAIAALGSRMLPLRGRDWTPLAIAVAAAVAVMAPNILWHAQHGFPGLAPLLGDGAAGRGMFDLPGLAVFAGTQVAIVGPVFLIAILLAAKGAGLWHDDQAMRLMAWQTLPMLAAAAALALAGKGGNAWAAPAYVGGVLLAARWLITAGGWPALRAQLWIGLLASAALWTAAGLYAGQSDRLTARLDPFREMRAGEPFCELALGIMADEGAEVLLSDDRQRLSECMFLGGLGWDEVAVWNPEGLPRNHSDLTSALQPGDDRAMLLVAGSGAARMAHHFREASEVESGRLATHLDRDIPYEIWAVQGFKGY